MQNLRQQTATQQAKSASAVPQQPGQGMQPGHPPTPQHMPGPGVVPPLSQNTGNQPRLPLTIQPPAPSSFPPAGQSAHPGMPGESPQRPGLPTGATATPAPEEMDEEMRTAEGSSSLAPESGRQHGESDSPVSQRKLIRLQIHRRLFRRVKRSNMSLLPERLKRTAVETSGASSTI